jgi:hypothetical protein
MTTESDAPTMLDMATEAVHDATEAVQATTQSIAGAIEAGGRPGGLLDQLVRLTRDAPLPSLDRFFTRFHVRATVIADGQPVPIHRVHQRCGDAFALHIPAG